MSFSQFAQALFRGPNAANAFGQFTGASVPAAFSRFVKPTRTASAFSQFAGASGQTLSAQFSSAAATPFAFDANGVAVSDIDIEARDGSDLAIAGLTFVLTATPKLVDEDATTIGAQPGTILNDGSTSTISVQVFDADGYPVWGLAASRIVLSSTGTGNTIVQPTGFTDYAGRASGTLASTVAETKTVSATILGGAITATVAVVVTAVTPTGFPNEPSGYLEITDWQNEATLNITGLTADGNPNSVTGGLHRRVTSGYPGGILTPGTAVIETYTRGGKRGGYDPGRMQASITGRAGVFLGVKVIWPTGYPFSNNDGGGKQWFVTFSGSTPNRYFLNLTIHPSENGVYRIYYGSSPFASTTAAVVLDAEQTIEWWLVRGGAGADEMHLWVDGVLAYSNTALTFPAGAMALAYDDGSNNGNHLDPATYICAVGSAVGTFDPAGQETVSWAGGTGVLQETSPESGAAATMLFIQMATGVPPAVGQTITGGTSGATAVSTVLADESRAIGYDAGAPADASRFLSRFRVSVVP